jgi:hypothetical protein
MVPVCRWIRRMGVSVVGLGLSGPTDRFPEGLTDFFF